VATNSDSYLQAAEGFLFAVRDDIDQLDLRLDDSLKIAEVFALVSIARALSRIAPPPPTPIPGTHDHTHDGTHDGADSRAEKVA
jgi:hypothetical protein